MANLYEYEAKIVEVYDGDTVTAIVNLGFSTFTIQKFRLARINAPEVRGDEKVKGKISRDRLRRKILGKTLIVKTLKDHKGKYGRYLAEIILDYENINDWLVEQNLAEYREY